MRRQSRAFTLVELLVVIGIIAVLISILLPALSRARQQAISAQCMSNMKNVGLAALMYANENKGWYPPSNAADPPGNVGTGPSRTDEKFLEYAKSPNASDQYIVSVKMAQYAGYKFRPWQGPADTTYSPPKTPIFFCPADDQPVNGIVWEETNLLTHATGTNSGNNNGKFRYWWVANPWYNDGAEAAIASSYGGNVDLAAAQFFAHMDQNPDQTPGGPAWFDGSRACVPGIDYVRRTKDKHVSEVAIMVDRSKQQQGVITPGGGVGIGFMMHGSSGPNSKKGWKNELFGDGHCESRRLDRMRQRWAPANPQAW